MLHLRNTTIRLCLLVLVSGIHLFAQRARELYNGREVSSNEVVIRLKDPNSGLVNILNSMLPSDSVQVLNQELGLVLVHSPTRPVAALLDLFANRGDLSYVEPNFTVQATATPNDPYLGQLWGLQKVGATLGWDITQGNNSSVVGVIDTGVSYTHPDLAANMWSAPTAFTVKVGTLKITCPAGSHGLNAISMTCDPADDHGHGTHVAGTIGAVGNNGVGVAGMNWGTSMMALKFMDASGSGSVSNAIRAINFAIQVKSYFAGTATPVNLRVLSNSWGGSGFSQALLDAINNAGKNNMLFVVAAGNTATNNDTSKVYPASYAAATQINVAATDSSDAMASFSSYGPATVQLGAPGVGIFSTYLGDGYASMSGTSMATPHVAGAAALVLSACPDLDTSALKNLLLKTVDVIPALLGTTSTGGRLNVSKALQSCNASRQPSVSSIIVSPSSLQSGQAGSITVGLTGAATSGGMVVTLATSDAATASVPATVTVPQGASTATVSFTAGAVNYSTAFTITASAYGISKSASGTVVPAPIWIPNSSKSSNPDGSLNFITGFSSNSLDLRNDYSGWVGMKITIGTDPLDVSSVGRACLAGNSASHTVKFVNASDGTDLAGGAAVVNMKGCTATQFVYGSLPGVVTLQSGSVYYLVTEESEGSDQWHDLASVSTRPDAALNTSIYGNSGTWTPAGAANNSYGPLDFVYISKPTPKTVNVSIKTNPLNQSLIVDGVTYTSAQTFQWTTGSSHSIGGLTQSGGSGVQYVWTAWSDGGAQVHTVTPSVDASFVASFKTQYLLSTAVTPAGTGSITASPSSPTGYYDAGSSVQLSAAPSGDATFLNWTGDLLGSLVTQNITMSGPRSLTAVFLPAAAAIITPPPVVTPPPTVTPPPAVVTPPPATSSSFVSAYGLSGQTLRNDFTGWVGMKLTVGKASLVVSSLGRLCTTGNFASHTVKFTNALTGTDVAGASATVNMASCTPGQFQFAALASSVTLPAGNSYYLVTQEVQGGDRWYDVGQIAITSDATVDSGIYAYSSSGSAWTSYGGPSNAYGPPSFQYKVGPAQSGAPLVTSFNASETLRNDYSGWVGMKLTVNANPITVSSIGRMCVAGNTGSHTVKFVNGNILGTDVTNGSVQINMAGCTPGQFSYVSLPIPITLQAKTPYYLVSQEASGGDRWYDFGSVSTNSTATVNSAVYSLLSLWMPVGSGSISYGPLNFK